MFVNPQVLFRPAQEQVRDRMAALEAALDVIAKETTSRFCRGNAAIQLGLLESEEELDAKREITIARRR